MQLSKRELTETQMIVTTPEKWDVITRKGSDVSIASLVKLLIIDEVHLLNDDRGPVIETIIARTLRQVSLRAPYLRNTTASGCLLFIVLQLCLLHFRSLCELCGVSPHLHWSSNPGGSDTKYDPHCWTVCDSSQLQRRVYFSISQ